MAIIGPSKLLRTRAKLGVGDKTIDTLKNSPNQPLRCNWIIERDVIRNLVEIL